MSRHRLVALSIIMVSPQHVSRLIRLVLNGSHHTRLLAELEAHDGFSDSREEMTEEQHGTLPCQGRYLLPLDFP